MIKEGSSHTPSTITLGEFQTQKFGVWTVSFKLTNPLTPLARVQLLYKLPNTYETGRFITEFIKAR
jgi:hypothetical protein